MVKKESFLRTLLMKHDPHGMYVFLFVYLLVFFSVVYL